MEKINSSLYYEILLSNNHDSETEEILLKLKEYTSSLENIVFPPPKDPLVKEWIRKKWIK